MGAGIIMAGEIEEIEKQARELTLRLKVISERSSTTAGQDKAAIEAYNGLLFWRRTDLALMIKAFGKAEDWL